MTDLECVEYATQVVLRRCREATAPARMGAPPAGSTVMEWFAAALNEAKSLRRTPEVGTGKAAG